MVSAVVRARRIALRTKRMRDRMVGVGVVVNFFSRWGYLG